MNAIEILAAAVGLSASLAITLFAMGALFLLDSRETRRRETQP